MIVVRYDNGPIANRGEWETDMADIREIAQKYGHTDDVVELYNDNRELVARAIWLFGYKCYKYSYGANLHQNPAWCIYDY